MSEDNQVTDTEAVLAFAEAAIVEDEALIAARERGAELGTTEITAATGATLALLARLAAAKAVVEIGTNAGVSGLWLLAGMTDDGVLTTIDDEPEHHQAAKAAFSAAGVGPGRTRLINGRAVDVLTRLTDGVYDIVFVNGSLTDQPHFVTAALRLVRPGGLILVNNVTANGRAARREATGPEVDAVRAAATLIADNDDLLPVVLPLGSGLLAAAKTR